MASPCLTPGSSGYRAPPPNVVCGGAFPDRGDPFQGGQVGVSLEGTENRPAGNADTVPSTYSAAVFDQTAL